MSIDFYPAVKSEDSNGVLISPVIEFNELETKGLIMNVSSGNAYAFADAMGWKIENDDMDDVPIDEAIETLRSYAGLVFLNYVERLLTIAIRGKELGAKFITGA